MRFWLVLFPFLSFLLFSCREDKNNLPSINVFEVKDIGVLSTSEYTIGKVIKLSDPPEEWYKTGERKILISCKAKIKAGIDLSEIKEGDIKVEGKTIEITLPPAKITTFIMDPEYIRTEMESITGFRSAFTQKEKNDFMQQGETAIREDLKETNILKNAERDARKFLRDFFIEIGYEEVIIKHTPNEKSE